MPDGPLGMAIMAMTMCRNLTSFTLGPHIWAADADELISRLPQSLTYLQLRTWQDVLSGSCWKAHRNLLHLDLENVSRQELCSASGLTNLTALTALTLNNFRLQENTLRLPSLFSLRLTCNSCLEGDPYADFPELCKLSVEDMAFPEWASKLPELAMSDRQPDPPDWRGYSENYAFNYSGESFALKALPPNGWDVERLELTICWTGGNIEAKDLLQFKALKHLSISQYEPPEERLWNPQPVVITGNADDLEALDKQMTVYHDESLEFHETRSPVADVMPSSP